MKKIEIKFTYIYSQFDAIIEEFQKFLEKCDREESKKYSQNLKKESKLIRENPVLQIAFIGQYSAGKSTIISALTGDKSIKIGSDITTDKATSYVWQGIKLVDTPGIGTERHDHDDVTYEAIKQADLLVFCTTHMLLDDHIVGHFKNLAYEKQYAHKMMLVFNKLSAEAGDDDQKIENYRSSIAQALRPHRLDDFPICFFDAQDYIEGINDNDEMLINLSRFSDFISELNQFIKDKDKLAQLDTPIRRVLDYVLEVRQWFINNPQQDQISFDTLNRLSRRVREAHQRLQIEVRNIFLNASSKVCDLGSDLANDLTKFKKESEFNQRQERIEIELQQIWNNLEEQLQSLTISSVQSLEEEIRKVLSSQIIVDFVAMLDANAEINTKFLSKGFNFKNLSMQVQFLKSIAEEVGMKITQNATRQFFKVGNPESLINVAGSPLHQTILKTGEFIGFKFKPWQAIKLANNFGKFAKFAGPIIAIFGSAIDAAELLQQEKQAQELRDAQNSIIKEFENIAEAMKSQLDEQIKEFENKTFNKIEAQIQAQREQYQNQTDYNELQSKELGRIQQKLELLIESLISY
jgi:GTP-binding protein EngB required for normal cell division